MNPRHPLSWDSSGMRNQTVLRFAAVREKRCLSMSLRELFYHRYPLCLTRWDCFPLQVENEIVAQRNLEEAIVKRRVISRKRDSIQGLGIRAESHERIGYQNKVSIEKCWSSGLAYFCRCLSGRHVHSCLLSRSTDGRDSQCSRKMPSSANDATINSTTRATSGNLWNPIGKTDRRRKRR